MPIIFVPPAIREVYFLFKDIFKECDFNYVDSCSMLLLFLLGLGNLCEFARNCPWSPSVSTLARLAKKFNPNRFMRRNQERILKKLHQLDHGDFCYAIDDTSNPKYGKLNFASGNFGSSSGLFFGQKILVLVIVNLKTQTAYPISYAFLSSKKDADHIPAHHRAIDLLEGAIHLGFPPLPVTSDSWFDSQEFIESVKSLGCDFAGELKSTRLARENSAPKSQQKNLKKWFTDLIKNRLPKNKFQKRKEKRGKAFSEKILFIKNLYIPLKVVAVYNRINGVKPFAFYATTNTSMTGARLWRFSRARWAIEVLFRDLKQSLGFGSLTAGGEGGAHMAVCLPLILLTSIRLDSNKIWDTKNNETLGTTVKLNREKAFSKTLDLLIHNRDSGKIKNLRARRKNPNQKPINFSGEKKSA